ncbi:protocadherin beta-14-like [Macrobrachium rosenbergii]|uniref:protocadherin beta-14-like n=1 Tax=Macrobrachium rosenbergii TaxID=79674 RepID=UPI0034D601B0
MFPSFFPFQLRYSFDPMASGDVRQKFALKTNGELWTTEPLDREEFKQYKIPIKVTDGVPAHERMTIYWITVQDLNDVPPVFDYLNGVYEVELPENREVGKSTGIKLAINDSDVVNLFEYHIVHGNGEQKFRIDEATGDIIVNKVLDYDHPVLDRNEIKAEEMGRIKQKIHRDHDKWNSGNRGALSGSQLCNPIDGEDGQVLGGRHPATDHHNNSNQQPETGATEANQKKKWTREEK